MEVLTLQQLFGVNASQDGQTLTVRKSDLPLLTPLATNMAESLLIAIALKAMENFEGKVTDKDGNNLTDPNGIDINYRIENLYEMLDCFQWEVYTSKKNDSSYLTNSIIIHQFTLNAN